jgi:hypothetical protein
MRKKHRNDYNHGKDGWIGGNPSFNGKRGFGGNDQRPHQLRTGATAMSYQAERYNKFYYSVGKDPADMTDDELDQEIESAESYFERCRQEGQGVGTKEGGRKRICVAEKDKRTMTRESHS